MRIAVVGKGGVGKTTITALLAHHFAQAGRTVMAIDTDPLPSLGRALGFSDSELLDLLPIASMGELIAAQSGTFLPPPGSGSRPAVLGAGDLPDRLSAVHNGIRLLLLGAVQQEGSNCICLARGLLQELVLHVVSQRNGVVLLDLHSGAELLGPSTAAAIDVMLAVAEPTNRSMLTVQHIAARAADIGVRKIMLAGNKTAGAADRRFFEGNPAGLALAGCLDRTSEAVTADRSGKVLYDFSPRLAAGIAGIAGKLEAMAENQRA